LVAVPVLHLHDLLLELGEAPPKISVAGLELVALDAALELLLANAGPDIAAREDDALGLVE
jgi:hypothetical protein